MRDTNSWIIEAIEKAAMERALAEVRKYPSTFRFMGYSPEQLQVILMHVFGRVTIMSTMTPDEIKETLRARYR